MKKYLIRIMDLVLLDCKQTSLLVAKKLDGELSFLEKLRLKMHLANCKFCYNFNIQSEKIDHIIKITPDELTHICDTKQHLDPKIKEKIIKNVADNE